MPIYSSAKRYLAIESQTGPGVAAAGGRTYIPIVRASTTFKWDQKIQDETAATGDYYTLVDGIPVQAEASGTIVVPFKPTTIIELLQACGLGGGDLAMPGWITVYIGNGPTGSSVGGEGEWAYKDVFFTGGQLTASPTASAQWSFNFLGLQQPASRQLDPNPSLPAYERAYRLKDLHNDVQLLSDNGVTRVDSLTLHIVSQAVAYHGTRQDGLDGPSDIILERLGAGLDIVRGFHSEVLKAAFIDSCGDPGSVNIKFTQTCNDETHSALFDMPNSLLAAQDLTAPDNAPITETLSFNALRSSTTSGSPLIVTYTAS